MGLINDVYTPLTIFFAVLLLAAFVVELWAFADAIRRPAAAFPAAGKQTKQIWLIILGVASALGLYSFMTLSVLSILSVAAFVAGAIYQVDVKPKVKELGSGRGKGTSYGPYGPW